MFLGRNSERKMFKVIFKTALKTLLFVAVLALVAFGVASLGFPSEMAGLCEKSGNYSMATGYASLSYAYSKNVNDLNRCFIDSVYAENDNDIVKFGDELISNEKFPEVCENNSKKVITENGTEIIIEYVQYVHGNVAAAKFRKGDREEALKTAKAAMNGVQGFPKNNALSSLSLAVIEKGDCDFAKILLDEIQSNHADAENNYYNALVNELKKLEDGKE